MVEFNVKATGKTVVESRQTKRAQEEKGAQKAARRTLTPPKPDYKLVSLEEWEHAKQTEGTYRYDHKEWQRTRGTPGASAAIGPGPSRSVRPCTCASRPWSRSAARSAASPSVRDLRPPPAGKDPKKGEHHHAQQPEGAGGPLLLSGRPRHVRA
jgi:hypothetical protein